MSAAGPQGGWIVSPRVDLALLAIPYLKYDDEASGRWFLSQRGRNMVLVAAGIALVGTSAWVVLDEIVSDPADWIPAIPPVISHGLIPLAVALVALTILYFGMKRTYSATKNEAIQAVFAVLATGLLVLTAVGIWFRGPGMALQWPWSG